MAIFRLIPAGDLKLENGDLVWIGGVDQVRQEIACRFRFFLGEWFLDKRQGLPYHRDVLKKGADLAVVRSVFRRTLLRTPGVISIRRFEMSFDARARQLSFDFECLSQDGPIVVSPQDRDFILDT